MQINPFMTRKNFGMVVFPIIFIFLMAVSGCFREKSMETRAMEGQTEYANKAVGFSVLYPDSWGSNEQKLPDRWAIKDANNNAVLFMSASIANDATLDELSIVQAKADMGDAKIDAEKLKLVVRTINISTNQNQPYGWF